MNSLAKLMQDSSVDKAITLVAVIFVSILSPAQAADYTLISYSMIYNVDTHHDEYIAYLVDNKMATIFKCKSIYKLTDNTLTADKCDATSSIPFSLTVMDASIVSTVVFIRAANHQNGPVFGPDGIWRLDQSNGNVEFCVFGDITPKCVILNQN
jgi:hypothetical protein